MTTLSTSTRWNDLEQGITNQTQAIVDGKLIEEESKTKWYLIGVFLLLLTAGMSASLVLSAKSLAEVEQGKASLVELSATVAPLATMNSSIDQLSLKISSLENLNSSLGQLSAAISSLAGSIVGSNNTPEGTQPASFLCIGEIVSREQIDWNLVPHGYSHTSWLPTVRVYPRPACASVMPTWAGGSSKDDPNNYFLINTSGRYLVRAWGSWDGMTGTVIDHNGGVTCYKPSGGEQRASLWYELANRKIIRFQGTTMMDLVAGDRCSFSMYVWWGSSYPGSEQASNGVEFELRNVAID